MNVRLRDIAACFEGMIPPVVATCAKNGTPNVVQISQVHLVDDEHVALSNQFFSTTVANLAENPVASVMVIDPESFITYRLTLEHVRSETSGAVFDQMDRRIEAIASLTGMAGVFALRAAEVFRVTECQPVAATPRPEPATDR